MIELIWSRIAAVSGMGQSLRYRICSYLRSNGEGWGRIWCCFVGVFDRPTQRKQRFTKRMPWLLSPTIRQAIDRCLGTSAFFGNLWLRQFAVTLYVGDDDFPVHVK